MAAPTPTDREVRTRHIFSRLMDGQSMKDIAAAESVTVRRIQQIVADELKRAKANPANDHNILQIARLEIAFDLLGSQIEAGKTSAVPLFLKVIERLSELNGNQVRLTVPPWRENGDVEAVIERLDRLQAAREIVAERRRRWAQAKAADETGQVLENKANSETPGFAPL